MPWSSTDNLNSDVDQSFTPNSELLNPPAHVAIIMDGNRRWAKEASMQVKEPVCGHYRGVKVLFNIVKSAMALGINQLTVFGFSTENWQRSEDEVSHLMRVIALALSTYGSSMKRMGIQLKVIGNWQAMPDSVTSLIKEVMALTQKGERFTLTLALNYGARDELKRVMQKIASRVEMGEITSKNICQQTIEQCLDTADLPDPDLVIRTSGEMRLSNFLLWQSAYSELYFSPKLWPDFSAEDLLSACLHYQARCRRMGK